MDYAVEHARCHELNMSVLAPINHVRILKRMYLPCELIGLNGRVHTKEYDNINDKITIIWSFDFDKVPPPSKKSKRIWINFIQWLSNQNVETKMILSIIVNFNTKCPMIRGL